MSCSPTAPCYLRCGRLHQSARKSRKIRLPCHRLRCGSVRNAQISYGRRSCSRLAGPTDRIGAELGPRDAVCVLTHDAKFDVPAIVGALPTRVGYLGAMGSRQTHEKRVQRLLEEGVTRKQLERVRSPIGLDIGGRTPEETAVSIFAEIIAMRTGHDAPSLSDGEGSIH